MNRRGKILSVIALLLVVGMVALYVHHRHVKGAVARYKAELVARGEPMTWQEIVPAPNTESISNAALLTSIAERLPETGPLATNPLRRTQMRLVQAGKAMAGWPQPWVTSPELTTSNTWPGMIEDYLSHQDWLLKVHVFMDQPSFDFQLDYSLGVMVPLGHLRAIIGVCERLCAAAACEQRLGNLGHASAHLQAGIAIIKGLEDEPLLISQVVRARLVSMFAAATWDYLQAPDLDDERLATMQCIWSSLRFQDVLEQSLLLDLKQANGGARRAPMGKSRECGG